MEGIAESGRKVRTIKKLEKPATQDQSQEEDEVKVSETKTTSKVRLIKKLDKPAALATYDVDLAQSEPVPEAAPERDNRAMLRQKLRSMRNQRTGRGMPDMPHGKQKKKLVKAYKSSGVKGVLGKMGIDDPELTKIVAGAVQSGNVSNVVGQLQEKTGAV